MENLAKIFGGVLLTICALLPLLCASTLVGAVAGWAVGLFFQGSFDRVLPQIGIHASLWDIGAVSGFFGGFLRTKVDGPSKTNVNNPQK